MGWWAMGCDVVGHRVAPAMRGGVTSDVVDEVGGSEGNCAGVLNPLAISHTPIKTSHRPPGIAWIAGPARLLPRADPRVVSRYFPSFRRAGGLACTLYKHNTVQSTRSVSVPSRL